MTDKNPHIEVLTEKSSISDAGQIVDVLIRITPPESDAAATDKRPKLNFGIALDRSGSMGGEKMRQAREAAKYCVDQLVSTDTFSAVIFDDSVDVLFTNGPVRDREMLKRGLDRIEARNSTALHEGWVKAGLQVSETLEPASINRVLLITDGQANVGETRVDRIVSQAREAAARGLTTSTIGIGSDFNEDLLMPMAEAGQGNAWHVREPLDMVRIFETEMHGLINQVGHSVTLKITPAAGFVVDDVLNDLERDAEGRIILPNLKAGSAIEVVVRLKADTRSAGTEVELAHFEMMFIDQQTNERNLVTALLTRRVETQSVVDAQPVEPAVVEAVALMMNARARKEMMEHLDRGDRAGARRHLDEAIDINDIAFCFAAQSPRLRQERQELEELKNMVANSENDVSTRKRLAYSREATRKSR